MVLVSDNTKNRKSTIGNFLFKIVEKFLGLETTEQRNERLTRQLNEWKSRKESKIYEWEDYAYRRDK